MSELLTTAIRNVQQSKAAWCRFITGNDTGSTGSHQAGFYIPKCASALLFDEPGKKGENKEKSVQIKWQDDIITDSRMKYYGQGTRNEYRITRFGKDFPFLHDDNVGDLLIIAKCDEENYVGYVLSSDEDIDGFFAYFNLAPGETNQLIDINGAIRPEDKLDLLFSDFISNFTKFPETRVMSKGARDCYNHAFNIDSKALVNIPDDILINWIDAEFKLFKHLENKIYADIITNPFNDVDTFVRVANEILNRRKSRAGKSLEHHLANIFTNNNLLFEEQAVTEGNKKPDFLFPNGEAYHNLHFPAENLIVLGAKTTCKDRWRQIVTEADRVDTKYLFTLQQAISKNQLKEMKDSKVILVVPRQYIKSFPAEYQHEVKSLSEFIETVKHSQANMPKNYMM